MLRSDHDIDQILNVSRLWSQLSSFVRFQFNPQASRHRTLNHTTGSRIHENCCTVIIVAFEISKSIFAALKISKFNLSQLEVFFILLTFHFPTQQRSILRYIFISVPSLPIDAMKIKHVNNVSRAKIYAFILPPETCKCWAKKTMETKAILTRGGTGEE